MTTTSAGHPTSGIVPFSPEKLRETLAGSRNPEETLSKLVFAIQQRLQTDVCSVYLLEQNRSHLVLAATVGLRGECVGRVRMALHEGLAGMVAEQLRPIAVEDAMRHPRFKYFAESGEDEYHSYLGVPIVDRGLLQGVLVVQSAEARSFLHDEIDLLTAAGKQLASSWRRSSAIADRSNNSSRQCRSGSGRWPLTSAGAGMPRRKKFSATSIPCAGTIRDTTRSRCSPSSPSTTSTAWKTACGN